MYLRNLFLLHPWPVGAILSLAVPCLLQEVVMADEPPAGYRLVYSQDFQESDALHDFQFSDPDAWRLGTQNGRHFMEQFQKEICLQQQVINQDVQKKPCLQYLDQL